MSENRERAYELLEESLRLDDGDERIAVCEDAVAEADLSGDLQTRYRARELCLRAHVFGGAPEKGLVGFSWLLAQFDGNPGEFSEWGILWKYKWILSLICDFPQIPKARIYEMLGDFETRALRAGYGLHAVYHYRYRTEKFRDDKESAREYFQKMIELSPDELSNCSACLKDEMVSSAIYFNDDARAAELALPLLDGKDKCASVPHRTYANLLLPMVRLGRQKEGLHYHRAGYRLVANSRGFFDRVAQHLIFLTLTENFERACALFEKHYPWTEHNWDSLHLFHFFRASWFLFYVVSEKGAVSHVGSLRSFGIYHDLDYQAFCLAFKFKEQAEDLAKQFDLRNETDFFTRTLRETPALQKWCAPFPLSE